MKFIFIAELLKSITNPKPMIITRWTLFSFSYIATMFSLSISRNVKRKYLIGFVVFKKYFYFLYPGLWKKSGKAELSYSVTRTKRQVVAGII